MNYEPYDQEQLRSDVWYYFRRLLVGQAALDYINRVKAQLVKRRTKPAICPVTGNETYSRDGLHIDAWKLMADGIKYREAQDAAKKAADRRLYAFQPNFLWLEGIKRGDGTEYRVLGFSSFDSVVEKMLGQRITRIDTHNYHRANEMAAGYEWLHPYVESKFDSIYTLSMNEQEKEALIELRRYMLETIQRTLKDGEWSAAHWLTGMATGKVSLETINRLHSAES